MNVTDLKIQQLVASAMERCRDGDLDGAIELMLRVVASVPDDAGHHNNLGVLYAARREPARAEACYRRAIELRPGVPAAHLNLGNALRDQGRWPEATQVYEQATKLQPDFAEAHRALGAALRALGRFEEAAGSYQRALKLRPNSPELLNDLGGIVARLGRTEEAIECFRRAIGLLPQHAQSYRILGALLLQSGRVKEAATVLTKLVQLEPSSPKARSQLGTALASLGRHAEAIEQLRRAVRLDPNFGQAWCNIGLALEDLGKREEAADALAQARRLLPDSRVVAFHCGATGAGPAPPACPDEYLLDLFDGYADRFDDHLFNRLAYRGPQLLLGAVRAVGHSTPVDVADLGCGTGAAGPLFRPLARKLVGVDLSPRMLDKARQRGAYDELARGPIVEFLQSRRGTFDLLLAADVFIYIGDLRDVFRAAREALRPGGLFAFTIETIEGADYVLRPTRRYAQSSNYIGRLAQEFGFEVAHEVPAIIRAGEGPAVAGAVIVLRRVARAKGSPTRNTALGTPGPCHENMPAPDCIPTTSCGRALFEQVQDFTRIAVIPQHQLEVFQVIAHDLR